MVNQPMKTKTNGLPVVSKRELDTLGEDLIWDFQPEAIRNPSPVDIERFVECYLRMTPDYQYLSHNGVYLGMTVFNDTDKVPVYDPSTNRAEYISAKAGTVIIDTRLLAENQQHRYRFTLGHEGSHSILHSEYFAYQASMNELYKRVFGGNNTPMIQCRMDNTVHRKGDYWSDRDWMEWQANSLSSAILMPKRAVEKVVESVDYKGANNFLLRMKLVSIISNVFDVSTTAAEIRLSELGLVEKTKEPTTFDDYFPSLEI